MNHNLPIPSIAPLRSWIGSLRPNSTSLRAPEDSPPAAGSPVAPVRGHKRLVLGAALACAAIAGVATLGAHPRSARVDPVQTVVSGRAGLRKTPSGTDERWYRGTVTVTIDPSLARATPSARDAIIGAFGAWASSGASIPQLSFDATSTPGEAARDGVNRLLLGPITTPGHEDDLALTFSYVDDGTGEVVEADTIFNSAYDWTSMGASLTDRHDDGEDECHQTYDLQNVATHEAGHFLGLGEDYDDQATTMYVSSKPCQTSKRELTRSDVSVVSGLYAQEPAKSAQAKACNASITGRGGAQGTELGALVVLGMACARRRRRTLLRG